MINDISKNKLKLLSCLGIFFPRMDGHNKFFQILSLISLFLNGSGGPPNLNKFHSVSADNITRTNKNYFLGGGFMS